MTQSMAGHSAVIAPGIYSLQLNLHSCVLSGFASWHATESGGVGLQGMLLSLLVPEVIKAGTRSDKSYQ